MNTKGMKLFLKKWIILEPIIFLNILNSMTGVPLQNIYYGKIYSSYNSSHVEDNSIDEEVQEKTNIFIRNTILVYSLLSAIVMMIIGPLSDKYGRKYGILWTVAFNGLFQYKFLNIV